MVQVPYASAVCFFMYVMICTRPDLAQAVSQVIQYMSNPGRQHCDVLNGFLRTCKVQPTMVSCLGVKTANSKLWVLLIRLCR